MAEDRTAVVIDEMDLNAIPSTPEEDEAWALAMGEEPKKAAPKAGNEEAGEKPDGGEGDTKAPEAPENGEKPKAPEPPEVEHWQKVARDNQAWGTRLAQEKAELEKRLAALEAKAKEAPPKADELPPEAQKFLADWPEAKAALDHVAKASREAAVREAEERLAPKLAQVEAFIAEQTFMQSVTRGYMDDKGVRVPGHVDAPEIVASPEFEAWMRKSGRNPQMTAAEAIQALGDYKREAASKAVAAHDTAAQAKRVRLTEAAGGAVPADRRKGPTVTRSDEDEMWALATKDQ